jgi:6-phosphogluconolactonase (cycloisomerase 2 family)
MPTPLYCCFSALLLLLFERRYHPYLNVLYVLSECIDRNGYLTAYSVDGRTGELSELGRVDMTGKSTCYISFDKGARHAVITNYWDGVLNVVELDERTGAPLSVVQSHQQTRRKTWRQVEDRAVSTAALALSSWQQLAGYAWGSQL